MKGSSIKFPRVPIKVPIKVPKSLDKLLHNKYVLYGCILLSIASLFRLGNMNALITFVIIGGLMTFFSKNMIIILIIPLIIINLLFIKKNIFEGMEPTTDNCGNTLDADGNITNMDKTGNTLETCVESQDKCSTPNDIWTNTEGDIFGIGGTAAPVCSDATDTPK